jgi:hypothetical protein
LDAEPGVDAIESAATGCASYTTTLAEHVKAGRAIENTRTFFIFQFTSYYAQGTGELLGSEPAQTVTLYLAGQSLYTTNAASCLVTKCGDGRVDVLEECDGPIPIADAACSALGTYVSGNFACTPDCKLDMSACVGAVCGNGLVDPTEDCDGAAFKSCTDIDAVRYGGGTLKCDAHCAYDTSACTLRCGNGIVDEGEDCDGTARAPDKTLTSCSDFVFPYGAFPFSSIAYYAPGAIACDANCQLTPATCKPAPGCYWKTSGARQVDIVCY